MFRTILELLQAVGRRDPEALRIWRDMQGDERQLGFAFPQPEAPRPLTQQESFARDRELREQTAQRLQQYEASRAARSAPPPPRPRQSTLFPMSVADPLAPVQRATPIEPPIDEVAAGQRRLFEPPPLRVEQGGSTTGPFRYAAQPRLMALPPIDRVDMPRARVRTPDDATPPPEAGGVLRPSAITPENFDQAVRADRNIMRRLLIDRAPELVRALLERAFRDAENANDPQLFVRVLRSMSEYRKQMPRTDVPSGRRQAAGADTKGDFQSLSGQLGGASQIVGESGISLGRGASTAAPLKTGRGAYAGAIEDSVGFDALEDIAVQTAKRMGIENMLPEYLRAPDADPLFREITAAAESVEAAARPSKREVLTRLTERTRSLTDIRNINRFFDDVKAAVESGDLNKFDAEELRKTAELANTKLVREILSSKTFPRGLQIAQRAVDDVVFVTTRPGPSPAASPLESMHAAIATSKSRDELMKVRDIYSSGAFEKAEVDTLNKALARQLARIEMDDTQLQSFFGYTDWAYMPGGKVNRFTPGVRGMKSVGEVPQETQLPIAIRAELRAERIRDKMIRTMRRRKMWESDVAAANRLGVKIRGFEDFDFGAKSDEYDNLKRQLADLEEYGIGSPEETAGLRARIDRLDEELAAYEDAARESVQKSIAERLESGLEADEARALEKEPVQGVSGRDKYVEEAESDFLLRMLGYDDTGRRRTSNGRPRMGQILDAVEPKNFDDIEVALESAISGNRISEDFANQIMDEIDNARASVEGSAIWRGKPDLLGPKAFENVEPANPSDLGAVAITKKSDKMGNDYESRTKFNAETSDVTIAVANWFDTGGEFLTRNYAKLAGKEFLPSYVFSPEMLDDAEHIVSRLNKIYADKGSPLVINGAGNTITDMPAGSTQNQINGYVTRLLEAILSSPNRQFEILGVKTGGQSGADIAWVHAARQLSLPVRITPAYGQYGGIRVIMGEGFGYKESATAYLKEAQYRQAMGLNAENPYKFDYPMSKNDRWSDKDPLF